MGIDGTGKKFARDALLKSKRFSHVQQDFLAAILCDEFYTITEAEDAVDKAMTKNITGGDKHGGRNMEHTKQG